MAYETARAEVKEYIKYNLETGKEETIIEYGTLYGWQNDIV